MNHQATIQAAIAGIAALGFAALHARRRSGPVTPKSGQGKCYGIAKAGQNDCGTAKARLRRAGAKADQRPDGVEIRTKGPARRWAARCARRRHKVPERQRLAAARDLLRPGEPGR
jgi:uncharacterized membrane protein